MPKLLGVWFPAIQAGTGADMFTVRLADALNRRGIRAEITWLPHRAEYAPWTVAVPKPPEWANIVHINTWLHQRFIPAELPVVATLHSCVHDPALEPYKGWLQRLYHRNWIKRCEASNLSRADVVTAVSHYTENQAKFVFGYQNIVTIYNWIDTKLFYPDNRKTPNYPFRLLFVGNLKRMKGADLLPKIMHRLGKQFELRYTGRPEQFNSNNLPANMIALGHLHDQKTMSETYRSCDALLFPTRLEGLSLATLEAQSCGRPVIATNGSSLPEVVDNNVTGILCPQDDINAFVLASQQLQSDPENWRNICVRARTKIIHNFNEENAINKYLKLYEEVG